ncbi:MAG: hypothetical protein M3R31_12500, partial [Pseudomonadota bacterium]|nr:hypothetical protein [Pseudomonadota bacterium]
VTLATLLGVALLTPPLVVLAGVGLFWPPWLGALGWIACAVGLARRPVAAVQRLRFDSADIVAVTAAIAFAITAAAGRDETLGAGRDQQVYAEAAVALSGRGNAWATYAPLDDADRALLRSVSGVQVPGAAKGRNGVDEPIKLAHPLAWPAWLAIAHTIFGIEGVYAANAAVFAVGGLLFFLLVRRVAHPAIAVAATILLFALPSSLWVSGISLSEPLAMTLLLGVPLLAASGARRSCWLSAAVLLAAILVRIDAALAVPATMTGALLAASAAPTRANILAARRFVLTQFLAFVLASAVYLALFPDYLPNKLQYISVIAAACAGLSLTAGFLTPAIAARVRRVLVDARAARLTTIAILVLLFAYAVEIRPALQPFSIIRHWSGLDGTRDFREDSVLNLATYLSWPILLAALAGICYSLWDRWGSRRDLVRPLLLALGIGPAILYLWFPLVSPDHPWAFRRFVPIIVPYALLFAAVFVNAVTRQIGRKAPAVGAVMLVLPFALLMVEHAPTRLLLRENDGMTSGIAAIANELPEALLVSAGVDENVAAALLLAYRKPVALIDGSLSSAADVSQVTKWIEAKAQLGRPAWLLHGPGLSRTGARVSQQREWWLTRRFLVPSNRPPATTIGTRDLLLILSRVDGLDPSFATRMFGGEPVWGAREGGFFAAEVAGFGLFRHTDGNAWIEVPAETLRNAEALKVDVFTSAKEVAARRLRVTVDNEVAWTGTIDPGVSTLRVPIPKPLQGDMARIGLIRERVDVVEISGDDSRFGLSIGLVGIRPLYANEPVASGPGIQGFRSHLALVGQPPEPLLVQANRETNFVLEVENTGTAYWPTVRELGGPAGAVQIVLRWHHRGQPEPFVGDNRWPLMVSMLTGDRTRLRVPVKPIGLDGKPLPPGEYDLRIGMVRETVALFADSGDAVLSIAVVVTP